MSSLQQFIERVLDAARAAGRRALFEHEIYELIGRAEPLSVPRWVVRLGDAPFDQTDMARVGSDRVVLKLVADGLAHKSDVGGVRTVAADVGQVNDVAGQMIAEARGRNIHAAGVLLCAQVAIDRSSPAGELFIGMRRTRPFGLVLAAGLGGTLTEFWSTHAPGAAAVATAVVESLTGDRFLELFRRTGAYALVSGRARGSRRLVSDADLAACFEAFCALGKSLDRAANRHGATLEELEVNPFAATDGGLIALDGWCRLGDAARVRRVRPATGIDRLVHPKSIAVVGVSQKSINMGRVILRNIIKAGFDRDVLWAIKAGADRIDDIACVARVGDLPVAVDLLVVTVPAAAAPGIIDEVIETRRARAVILIPGGLGETDATRDAQTRLRERIDAARQADPESCPVILGGNCLGILSRPGRCDTMFIPDDKLDKHADRPDQPIAIVSQSGAFAITRMSNLGGLRLRYVVTVGNQLDLTVADVVGFFVDRTDVAVIGVYVEGFLDGDGGQLLAAVRRAVDRGRQVVFYKAGRTAAGRAATAGHTASVAGDYRVCAAALRDAGAMVTGSLGAFEAMLMLAVRFCGLPVSGGRIFAMTNAGYESVAMADAIGDGVRPVGLAELSSPTQSGIATILEAAGLSALVNVTNPLDVTPMATAAVYEDIVRRALNADEVDAVIVSCVPLTPAIETSGDHLADTDSIVTRLARLAADSDKPLVAVIDSGGRYDALVGALADADVPVFRSADTAMTALSRYLANRLGYFDA